MRTIFTERQRRVLQEAVETSENASAYVPGFLKRHPKIARVFHSHRLKVHDAHGGGGSHPDARQEGDHDILLFPKFWHLGDDSQRDGAFAHEVGHAVLEQYGMSKFIKLAQAFGIDVWDTPSLPYAQHNFHEAFADSFAEYFLYPRELKRRYPQWLKLVEAVLGLRKPPANSSVPTHKTPEPELDWKATAKRLMGKRRGNGQDDLHYRAYMRAIIAGQDPSHLTKQFSGAREARQDLIDQVGM